jgi:hypothetical protein
VPDIAPRGPETVGVAAAQEPQNTCQHVLRFRNSGETSDRIKTTDNLLRCDDVRAFGIERMDDILAE